MTKPRYDRSGDDMPVLPEGVHPIDIPQREWVRDARDVIQAFPGDRQAACEPEVPATSGLVELERVKNGRYRIAVWYGENDADFLWLSEAEFRDLRAAIDRINPVVLPEPGDVMDEEWEWTGQ